MSKNGRGKIQLLKLFSYLLIKFEFTGLNDGTTKWELRYYPLGKSVDTNIIWLECKKMV